MGMGVTRITAGGCVGTLCLAAIALWGGVALAQESPHADPWDSVEISTLWYLSYGLGEEDGEGFNRTHIGRGYLTLEFEPVAWFKPRVTIDTHQDDSGDWKLRLKYLHGKFVWPIETAVITEPNLEVGLVHNPWFDYEEHIDNYRMQGTMFIERNDLLNSADMGVTLGGLLGDKLDETYRERVSRKYPGRYGSFALGVYNGGGYHAVEQNTHKTFMSRLSVRPLGFVIPNLQLSHFFVYGNGNTAEAPDWRLHDFMASFEHPYFVVTAQYAMGEGNQKGTAVDDTSGASHGLRGTSFFGEARLPWIHSSLFGRYDWFEWDVAQGVTERLIVGYALHFLDHNAVVLDLDRVTYEDGRDIDWQAKVTLKVHYP